MRYARIKDTFNCHYGAQNLGDKVLGICYFDLGLVDEAIAEFKKAIGIKPNHANAHYNLGIAYGVKRE